MDGYEVHTSVPVLHGFVSDKRLEETERHLLRILTQYDFSDESIKERKAFLARVEIQIYDAQKRFERTVKMWRKKADDAKAVIKWNSNLTNLRKERKVKLFRVIGLILL